MFGVAALGSEAATEEDTMGIYLEHSAIPARDTRALAQWYCDRFGLKIVFEGPPELHICIARGDKGSAVEIVPVGDEDYKLPDSIGQDYRHLAFSVEDFDAAMEGLISAGVEMEEELTLFDGTVRISFGSDPEGNRFQIVWRTNPLPE